MDPIEFEFEDKQYRVSMDAYTLNLAIRLPEPDGRLIRPDYWNERMPPIPMNLRLVEGIEEHVIAELVA